MNEIKFTLSDNGDIHVITDKGSMNLGPEEQVSEAMAQFLAERDFGERQ